MKKFLVFILIVVIIGGLGVVFWNSFKNTQTAQTLQDISRALSGAQPRTLVSFIVFGDNEGVNPVVERILKDAKEKHVDFVVSVADVTSSGSKEEYEKVAQLFRSSGVQIYTALGNNDLGKPRSRQLFYDIFHNPSYYSFDAGPAHFVVLDNADRKVGFDEEQLQWLSSDLDATKQSSIFLFYHRPFGLPLSEVFGDDETKTSRASNERFLSLIAERSIIRIYNGHLHLYFPYTLSDIPVTITGGGGAAPQDIIGGEATAFYHYILVRITEDGVEQEVIAVE